MGVTPPTCRWAFGELYSCERSSSLSSWHVHFAVATLRETSTAATATF